MDIKLKIGGMILFVWFLSGCYPYYPKNEMRHKANEYDKRGFHQTAESLRREAEELPNVNWTFGEEPRETSVFYTPPPETGQINFKINISTSSLKTKVIRIHRNSYDNKLSLVW
ncbi:MAG: hypothetical protein PHV60_07950 [bacterium]|nr:hypothetical protein [bacterium]